MRRGSVGLLLVVGIALSAAAPVAAARPLRWSAGRASGTGDLIGVACPASKLCVAVSGGGKVVVSGHPAAGAHSWKVVHGLTVLQTGGTLAQQNAAAQFDQEAYDVACPSVHLCLIGRPGAARVHGEAPTVSPVGSLVYSTHPLAGRTAWHRVNGIDHNRGNLGSLSCPSVHLCFALMTITDRFGNQRAIPLISHHPTGGASAWTVTGPSVNDYPDGLACPSAALCVAGGGNGLYRSTNPSGPTSSWSFVHHPATAQVDAVTCASTRLCLAQPDMAGCRPCGAGNDVISTHPAAGLWRQAPVATLDISCTSRRLCVGAAFSGVSVWASTNPAGGAHAWHRTRIRPTHHSDLLRGVSCASTSFCAAVGDGGWVAVGQR